MGFSFFKGTRVLPIKITFNQTWLLARTKDSREANNIQTILTKYHDTKCVIE